MQVRILSPLLAGEWNEYINHTGLITRVIASLTLVPASSIQHKLFALSVDPLWWIECQIKPHKKIEYIESIEADYKILENSVS